MEDGAIPAEQAPARPKAARKRPMRTFQVLVRSLASLTTLAASLNMLINDETSLIAGFAMRASYNSSSAFRFFVVGNAAAAGYSLLSLPLVSHFGSTCFIHLLDMLAMGLVMSSASAATAIAYVGKKGNDKTGWMQVCHYYEKFCFRVGIALLCSYAGFFLLYLACATSSFHKSVQRSNS